MTRNNSDSFGLNFNSKLSAGLLTLFSLKVYALPSGVDMPQAALSEPLSCLVHGWNVISPVNVGTKVLLLGAGIIGLLWASALHLHGLRKTVTVSELQERRREMVEHLSKYRQLYYSRYKLAMRKMNKNFVCSQ